MLPDAEMVPPSDQQDSLDSVSVEPPVPRGRLSRRPDLAPDPGALEALLERRGRVRVPWRVVSSPSYPDAALSVYVKVAALGWRPEGCTAGVSVIAGYLRLSSSTVERGLRALSTPDPFDGVVELRTRRRTKPGGTGTTAERQVRPVQRRERHVWVPVIAAELLEPRQLRAWAALAYADATGMAVSEAELGEILVHHSGKRAGLPIGPGAASAVVDSLEAHGWLKVRRREGWQGRHEYVVLGRPGAVVPEAVENFGAGEEPGGGVGECCGVGDGSGSRDSDGSPANKEDPQIDRCVNEGGLDSPAVGEAEVGTREAPVENLGTLPHSSADGGLALRADENSPRPKPTSALPRERLEYTGPELTFSARMAWIVEPVQWLLHQVKPYVQREFARELSAQMTLGAEPERLRARLEARFAATSPSEIRSVEGWLLKVAPVRWGCHDPRCESGVRWHSGEECQECLAVRMQRKAERERQELLAAGKCPGCLGRLDQDARCWTCRPPARVAPASPGPASEAPPSVPGPVARCRPDRCPGCGSWAEGRGADGRCRRCAVQHSITLAETEAMDAAGHGLSGTRKIAAAGEAAADVRRGVAAARAAATDAGLDEEGQDQAAVTAAEEAAEAWVARGAV